MAQFKTACFLYKGIFYTMKAAFWILYILSRNKQDKQLLWKEKGQMPMAFHCAFSSVTSETIWNSFEGLHAAEINQEPLHLSTKMLYKVPLDLDHHDDLWHLWHLDHPVEHKHRICWKPKLSNKQKWNPEKPKQFFVVPESVFRNYWISCQYPSLE